MLSVIGFKVPLRQDTSIRFEEYVDSQFYNTVHFHEEYQLTLILAGKGILKVGTEHHNFKSGEFYLFGKNLPHAFQNNEEVLEANNEKSAHYISVFFNVDSYGYLFNENPETEGIKKMLSLALSGLKLGDVDAEYLEDTIRTLAGINEFDKVIELLKILNHISEAPNNLALVSHTAKTITYDVNGINTINDVFSFLKSNYKNKISLESISSQFNMTTATFGRFFKLRTQKTFSQFLIETRVLKACELLRDGSHNITESCYDSGFTNISNFHRHFKRVVGMTPTQYKVHIEKK